ncbi:allantoicase [Actinacidiphila sp. bgisy167]|uniref:allantoicase n=1 Tax=Actinacidiphila sp. bgisy167 TaxID=3413797 RepID=UPI003D70D524
MTAVPRHTGAAQPYGGGDPYADYRGADLSFTRLVDLADRRLGAAVTAASDEFFAERENLLVPGRAEFRPGHFGHKGQVMDGWETRRRRGTGPDSPHPGDAEHDWALIRLAAPGVVRGVVVDTAHFRGNHPAEIALEAVCAPLSAAPADLLGDGVRWTELVPRTAVGGHAANGFEVAVERRFTHLRLKQFPDGGIARLRVHGEVVPDPAWLSALGTFDLVALENGGAPEDVSDRFYSSPVNLVLPGRSHRMGDGWETRRRRDKGHDWVRYRLAGQGTVRAVEIDTAYYKGNAPGWAALLGRDGEHGDWFEIVPRCPLRPDTVHRFVVDVPPATHVRLETYPDGGVARLRLWGSLTETGAARLARRWEDLA